MKTTLTALTLAAAFAIPSVWAATQYQQEPSNAASADQWERMAFADACMNGDVPALGHSRVIDERS